MKCKVLWTLKRWLINYKLDWLVQTSSVQTFLPIILQIEQFCYHQWEITSIYRRLGYLSKPLHEMSFICCRLSVASYSKSPPRDRIINHQIEGARTLSNSRSPSPPSQADQRSIRYIQDCLEFKICSESILLYNTRVFNYRYFSYFFVLLSFEKKTI